MKSVLLVLALSRIASAQPAPDPAARAKALYAEGKAHFDLAEYAPAIAVWKAAYKLSNAPMLLFNIGQAYRLSGDCTQALRFYATYEREAPSAANRDELELAKGRCDPTPTTANPPEPKQPPLDPPAPNLVVEPVVPDLDPDHGRSHAMPPPQLAGGNTKVAGLALGGAGLLLVGGSYYFARQASSRASEVEAHIGEWTTSEAAVEASGRRAATVSVVLGVAGGVFTLGGVALYLVGWRAARESRVTAFVTPNASGVRWSVSF